MNRPNQRQSAHNKAYYASFKARYSGKVIQRRGKREKQVLFFKAHPEAGSPSQVKMRGKVARRKAKKAKHQTKEK